MLSTSKMSTKGQIVIPKQLREALGLKPGDPVVMAVDKNRIILRRITLADLLEESARNYQKGKVLSHEETFKGLI